MHDDESITSFFLRGDNIINSMENFGDEIKDSTIVENTLRSLTSMFDFKVFSIE